MYTHTHICTPTYNIAVCTVKTPDDGHRNCPKHVDFCTKNELEKSVHPVGFVIRISSPVVSLLLVAVLLLK